MIHPHQRSCVLEFRWPEPCFNVCLVEPEIPPNTGNIARLCAATGTALHLVGPTGFRLGNAALRMAGLDYWPAVDLRRHDTFGEFWTESVRKSFFLFSTAGRVSYLDTAYRPGDYLIFGSESRGLPAQLLSEHPERVRAIPVKPESVRSLNLSSAVAIVLYEALCQAQR